MKYPLLVLLFGASMVLSATVVSAKEDRPYTDGPVTDFTYIRTKPGMFDEYMKWLATVAKQLVDEEKKTGIVLDAKVYTVEPRRPSDPDVILSITYPNMAVFDGLDDRLDAITEKVEGSVKKANDAMIGREKLREVLGSELVREVVFK